MGGWKLITTVSSDDQGLEEPTNDWDAVRIEVSNNEIRGRRSSFTFSHDTYELGEKVDTKLDGEKKGKHA